MGRKMKNAPVYFTLVQVRHNPVLSLEAYVSGIQESMRKAGYPDFKRGLLAAINLTPLAANGNVPTQAPTMQRVERYLFSDMANTRGFVLLQDSLSYQVTEYDTFESLRGDFLTGLRIVHDAIKLDFSQRVGIRYLDAVVPREGEEPKQYLVPEVIGLASRMDDGLIIHSFSETAMQVPNVGQIVSRTIIQNGQLAFPADLQPDALKLAARFAEINQVHAVIDTDGAFEGRQVFDIKNIETRLNALHAEITKAFQATVTDHARQVWA
jgi:uncharacterized protein (TIGR04255 family)